MTNTRVLFRLELDDVHPSLNKWAIANRFAANKEKQVWKEMVYWACKEKGIKATIRGPVRVEIHYKFKDKRRRDCDNYTPKFILDGLVEAGVLVDDSCDIVTELLIKMSIGTGETKTIISLHELDPL